VMSFRPRDFVQMASDKPFNNDSGLWLLLSRIFLRTKHAPNGMTSHQHGLAERSTVSKWRRLKSNFELLPRRIFVKLCIIIT